MSVIYEEVREVLDAPVMPNQEMEEDDFVIFDASERARNMDVVDAQEVTSNSETEVEEDQFAFSFDFPMKTSEEKPQVKKVEEKEVETVKEEAIRYTLSDDSSSARHIEVRESIEIIPVTETTSEGTKRYSLDDYMELERHIEKAKPEPKKNVEQSMQIERKTIEVPSKPETTEGDDDPFNQPLSKNLIDRAEERRAKMKAFNYKFRNSTGNIEEIEKQPAYKRAGVDLNDQPEGAKLSRTTLNTDDDEISLRRNNSFLHDNVD